MVSPAGATGPARAAALTRHERDDEFDVPERGAAHLHVVDPHGARMPRQRGTAPPAQVRVEQVAHVVPSRRNVVTRRSWVRSTT